MLNGNFKSHLYINVKKLYNKNESKYNIIQNLNTKLYELFCGHRSLQNKLYMPKTYGKSLKEKKNYKNTPSLIIFIYLSIS